MKAILNIGHYTFILLALACFAPAQHASAAVRIRVITTFDYPGTGNSTEPQKINSTRDIAGIYIDSSGVLRGFTRLSNGTFGPPIVDPNDTCGYSGVGGINDARLISGTYANGTDCELLHGFFRMRNRFRDFDAPGALYTQVSGVNNAGDFCGSFFNAATSLDEGFVSIGGTITSFSIPGATFTAAYQLNSSNQTQGYYVDSLQYAHGFWRESDGTLHYPINAPGSIFTVLFGNNDSNWIVGRYGDSAGITHGLFFVPPNRFFTFDYPGATFTSLNGINAEGYICGRYLDDSGIEHGLLAKVTVTASENEADTEMKAYSFPSLLRPTLREGRGKQILKTITPLLAR